MKPIQKNKYKQDFFSLTDKLKFKQLNYKAWLKNSNFWIEEQYIHFGIKEFIQKEMKQILSSSKCYEKEKLSHIVDIGCGSGWLGDLIKEIPNSYYTGIDYNPKFISHLEKNSDTENKNFIKCDIELENSLKLSNKADIIICCLSLIEMAFLDVAFKNMALNLNNKGKLLIIGLNPYFEQKRYNRNIQPQASRSKATSVIKKRINVNGKKSPSFYYRILYKISDYTSCAKNNNLTLIKLVKGIKKFDPEINNPVYNYLIFEKNE